MKATKEELEDILGIALEDKQFLDEQLLTLEEDIKVLTKEYNRINSLIGDTKNRLKKYAS